MATPQFFTDGGQHPSSFLAGRLVQPSAMWDFEQEFTAQQTNTLILAAQGANTNIRITDICITVSAADTVTLTDGSGNVKFKYYGSGTGDGVVHRFKCPITVATNSLLQVSSTTGASFFLAVTGYITTA